MVLVPGVELASCCCVSGLGLSLLAGGGPPWSPCWALCPVWLQLCVWFSVWLSALALLSSGERQTLQKIRTNLIMTSLLTKLDYLRVSLLQTQIVSYITLLHLEIASNRTNLSLSNRVFK